jgi:hypothetical protein
VISFFTDRAALLLLFDMAKFFVGFITFRSNGFRCVCV